MLRRLLSGLVPPMGLTALALLAGCGDGGNATSTAGSPPVIDRSGSARQDEAQVTVKRSRCPADLPGCRTAEGRITFVERVDPDGDGDAHFVILDSQSITLLGLTAIDVRKGLRPNPLPGIGDLISVAGPVQTGSYDQSQIHAIELHVGR